MQDQPDLIKDLVDRVYVGRAATRILVGRAATRILAQADHEQLPDPTIAVGKDIWEAITSYSEALATESLAAIEYEFRVNEPMRPSTVFGMPIELDLDLMPKEIRLRFEIRL